MGSTTPDPGDPTLRTLAESLLDPGWLDQPARRWWSRWFALQRAIGLDPSRLAAVERLVAVVEQSVGDEPLRTLTTKALQRLIADDVPHELWPTPLAAILRQPDDELFHRRWIALAEAAGGTRRLDGRDST